jgi:hypothetical protein
MTKVALREYHSSVWSFAKFRSFAGRSHSPLCKGTSVHFLTYPRLSYYPPHLPLSICILPIPLHHLQGPHSKADDFHIQSLMTFQKSTHQMLPTSHVLLCLYLSCIRASDTLGQVCMTLWTLRHHVDTHLWEAWY